MIVFFFLTLQATAQVRVKGKVINESTREPLAFANIVIKNTNTGTTTDIDGHFELTAPLNNSILIISSIGFETKTITLNNNSPSLLIKLKEKATQLNEIVIRPNDNPAFRIIRTATKNKPLHDPDNISSFTYNSYNKLYSTLLNPDTTEIKPEDDSAKFKQYIRTHHLFMHESYTERKYVKPDLSKEVVLGNHLSGIKDPFFAFLATDLQPLSFYKDFIHLFDKDYLSPLSPSSTTKYDFTLQDTLYQYPDSIYVISFEPLPGRVFEGLKGQLYISTDGYAIQSVHAQPADDKVLVESLIQQKYEKVNGHWFPVQLNSELRFKEFMMRGLKLKYVSHSYITNIKIDDNTIDKKEFGLANIEFAPLANRRDSIFWNRSRIGEFDKKEAGTFRVLDSVGEKLPVFQAAFKAIEGLFVGRFRAGKFYIPIDQLIQFNQYESARLGFGLQTGEKLSQRFMLEGYGAYGIQDKAFKYGGGFQINLSKRKEAYIKISYKQDINEPGKADFIKSAVATRTQESLRNWMASRMDSIEQYRVEFTERPFHFSQLSLFAQQQKRNPAYTYSFTTEENIIRSRFTVFEAGLQWRFAPKERYVKIGQSEVVTSMTYPQINFALTRSFAGTLGGEYTFTKVEARVDHQFITRGLGKTTFQLALGNMDGAVPYPFLFNGKGSKFDQSFLNNLLVNNYFQTMGLYEFSADRYAYLFINQYIGRITGNKSKYIRPELAFVHNMGVGNLRNKKLHHDIEFKTMEKGYFESGLIVTNLIRFNYLDLLYFGLGAGGFYRYGNYSLPSANDNLVAKLVVTLSF
ncbi:MAG TPA: DUF5686 family protein [Cyclobacteriaceae bacterium]